MVEIVWDGSGWVWIRKIRCSSVGSYMIETTREGSGGEIHTENSADCARRKELHGTRRPIALTVNEAINCISH